MTIEEAKRLKLTANFTIWEIVKSDTAIQKDSENGNTRLMDLQLDIPEKYILNAKRLCENVMQPCRNEIKMRIDISRGYSCSEVNILVGGVSTSDHLEAKAIDFQVPVKQDQAFNYIRNHCKFKQLIWERKFINGVWIEWIHVSYDAFNLKCEVLKFDGKKYIYL